MINTRTVNVSRTDLLTKLKENLQIHEKEYAEALVDFKARLEQDLKAAQKKVSKTEDLEELLKFTFKIVYPRSYAQQYTDVIEMLEISVDDTVELDSQEFKSYVKNEWFFTESFKFSNTMYKSAGAFLSE